MYDDQFEHIEAYINGELKGDALRAFEEAIAANTELAKQVSLYRSIEQEMRNAARSNSGEKELKQTLEQLNKKYFISPQKKAKYTSFSSRQWFAVAAVLVAAVITVVLYLNLSSPSKNTQELYAQFAIHSALTTQRGGADSMMRSAIERFNNKQYADALPLLTELLIKDSNDIELKLAKHICELETGKVETALSGFEEIERTSPVFRYQAAWYKALVYLKTNKVDQCKSVLQTIPVDADTYSKANELLKDLPN